MNNTAEALILLYHRIDETTTDPWDICVSPGCFEKHLRFLHAHFSVVSVEDLITQVKHRNVKSNTLCLTFDDGYADNFINAVPMLERYKCPATFFIPTSFLNHTVFWWDELESIFLHTKNLPRSLSLKINNKRKIYSIEETVLTKKHLSLHKNWRWYNEPPTTRCKIFLQIWKALQPLHVDTINLVIDEIKLWARAGRINLNRHTMCEKQLLVLKNHALINLGLHTNTHADLKRKSKDFQFAEISTGKKDFFDRFKIQTNLLAYPYGRFDKNSITAAKLANVDACFTTASGTVKNTSNLYALHRIQAGNWHTDELMNQLQKVYTNARA